MAQTPQNKLKKYSDCMKANATKYSAARSQAMAQQSLKANQLMNAVNSAFGQRGSNIVSNMTSLGKSDIIGVGIGALKRGTPQSLLVGFAAERLGSLAWDIAANFASLAQAQNSVLEWDDQQRSAIDQFYDAQLSHDCVAKANI